MGTPIDHKEIRKGDRVREITRITSHRDYTADMDGNTLNRYGNGDKSWELLDRPRKLIHAKGTELWLTTRYFPWSKGDRIVLREDWHEGEFEGKVVYPGKDYIISEYAVTDVRPRKLIHAKGTTLYLKRAHGDAKTGDPVTVREDYFEGERVVQAVQANGYKDGYPYESWLTTEKPRVLKWAKGTTIYLKADGDSQGAPYSIVLTNDVFEDDFYTAGDNGWYVSRFTDEKPEPHPVGAIRWVTEDHDGAYGVKFKKGDRVVVGRTSLLSSGYRDSDIILKIDPKQEGWHTVYGWRKYLSETPVEPAPTIVAVPLPAIEKLRDENDRAYDVFGQDAKRNGIRRNAIDAFLNNTREVKTALRGDEW